MNKAARVLYTGNRLCPNDLPMGLPCSTAACYRRFATTDEYDEDALWYTSRSSRVDTETFLTHQLGKFHYEVHALSMMLRPYDRCRTKAIYLYIDSVRVMAARATFDAGLIKYIAVQYRSSYWRNLYHDTMEIIPKNRSPSLQRHFEAYFEWFQSGEGSTYSEWPFTLYRARKALTNEERETILEAYEINI